MSAKCAVVKANRKSSSSYTQHGLVQHQLNFEMPMCCALSSFLIRVAARLLLFLRRQLFHVRKELFFSLFIRWICAARLILLNCGKRKQLNSLIYCQTLEKIFMHSSARKINGKRKRFWFDWQEEYRSHL